MYIQEKCSVICGFQTGKGCGETQAISEEGIAKDLVMGDGGLPECGRSCEM